MTVKDLKNILNDIPDDTIISSAGADSGGYDVITGTNVFTEMREGVLHIECEYEG